VLRRKSQERFRISNKTTSYLTYTTMVVYIYPVQSIKTSVIMCCMLLSI